MLVPVYVDYGKGWDRLGSANITGNSTVDLKTVKLPQAAKRAAIVLTGRCPGLEHHKRQAVSNAAGFVAICRIGKNSLERRCLLW